MSMADQEYERLKSKRLLPVLNQQVSTTDAYVLEDQGKHAASGPVDVAELDSQIVTALRTVHDPEIPLNIYDLGLIYGLDVNDERDVHVRMTLTAPGCPVAGSLIREVHDKVVAVPGVRHVKTELVWDPPWTRDRMSEAAMLELGLL
jgi:FeS assembly SUF system protein